MESVVIGIFDLIVCLFGLTLLFIGFKYWVDKGSTKFADKLNEEQSKENSKLKRELKTYKRLYKESQVIIRMKQQEITTLREIALDEEEIEEDEDNE